MLRCSELKKKYRGLKLDDLNELNPDYSCVICKKFKECGMVGRACINYVEATEEEFSNNYNFD